MSTFALVIGIVVAEVVKPGTGFGANVKTLDPAAVATYANAAAKDSTVAHILGLIPRTFFDAFANGDLLQVLLISILSGVVISGLGERAAGVSHAIDTAGKVFFGIIGLVVKLAPIGAFGAMAFTIGQYGLGKLGNLAGLIGTFYLTSLLFVLVVLGTIARMAGFSIVRFIAYIKDELLIVLGHLVVRDGAAADDAEDGAAGGKQACGGAGDPDRLQLQPGRHQHLHDADDAVPGPGRGGGLEPGAVCHDPAGGDADEQGGVGSDGRRVHHPGGDAGGDPGQPGAGRGDDAGSGIDKFMSECRALTNLVGNGVATVVVSAWEGELDRDMLRSALAHPVEVAALVEAQPVDRAI